MRQEEYQPIDMDYINMLTDGDSDEREALFEIFRAQMSDSINELKTSFVNHDDDLWHKVAHQMKGASASFGANYLSEVCKAAEQDVFCSHGDKGIYLKDITTRLDEIMMFINRG